jgi:hypothetical protein
MRGFGLIFSFPRRGTQIRDDDIQGTGDSGSKQWAAREYSVRKQRQRAGSVTRFSSGGMATSGSFKRRGSLRAADVKGKQGAGHP